MRRQLLTIFLMAAGIFSMLAMVVVPQDVRTQRRNTPTQQTNRQQSTNRTTKPQDQDRAGNPQDKNKRTVNAALSDLVLQDDTIPDSLLHPRWKIQRTTPITQDDLKRGPHDLQLPDNVKQEVVYNDTLNHYVIGSKLGDSYLNTPIIMTPDEYRKWSERRNLYAFFRSKNEEAAKTQGKEKFSFTDMHFDLGPAEKIFGKGGVRIKTQGTAELKFGATMKNIDNPSLPVRNRKTTTMDFDEKINVNVNGRVGDKVNMNLNYNTDATFDFDSQNLKLKYDGKEDEIIKLVEAGNVSFPSNSSLVTGASSLFGIRTDWQFGKLKLQTVISQKKSSSQSVSAKGGVQLTPFELDAADYEENRHFFLSHYFRSKYDAAMRTLPNLTTGIHINRIEIWVTNKTGSTANTRNIIALTDLGESSKISNSRWSATGLAIPSNGANNEFSSLANDYAEARNIDQTSTILDGIGNFHGGTDYEKLESARLLSSSEYTLNAAMGYVSLKTVLQTDQVLAVAYEFTYGGQTYQVGEFSTDVQDVSKALYVKALKNTSNNPSQGNWDLMMKNVYYLATSVEKDKFRLDVKFQSDTAGVYLSYIPEPQVKSEPIIRLLGADRLDNNNKVHSNGYFDYVEGYTVSNGRVFLPEAEPFGDYLYNYLKGKGVSEETAQKYCFHELYDSTKTVARQIAEKDKYQLVGQYRGTSANVIPLGAYNVPQGSVVVTAGGVKLVEGSDYSVDYSAGEVTILNQSILDAGTKVEASYESNTDYAQERKTMVGVNWEYDFSKNFQLSGTFQHLSEQSLTTKVAMGNEPLNNTLWGVNINWNKESQWLTNLLNRLPLLHCTQPSRISFTGEFAHLIAGQSHGIQDNASYLDDFENTKNSIDVSAPTSWFISSVPTMFPEYKDKTAVSSGYNRARLAWYTIDPLFTRRSSSLTPSHIKGDLDQLSNQYVREIYVNELFPNRQQSSYSGTTATLPILNLAYYPSERGPYNMNTALNYDGTLQNPATKWGGMMRKLDTNDFEAANIEYIEFWMLDPFIYDQQNGGDFYINLGEMSEDILRDGKKFYESGMPVDGSNSFTTTQWGKIPTQTAVTYAFATSSGSRALQDVGFNGLRDEEERTFGAYQQFLNEVQGKVSPAVYDSIYNDPANDNYHYFRGSDYDRVELPILERYKRINNPQGNSPDSENRTESYDTSYKTTPDVEDINQDHTLNEYERYYQYHVSIRPEDMVVGRNFIVDKRTVTRKLRNGTSPTVTWYQFRIPIDDFEQRVGGINDFTSVRFMRMFLTNFEKPIIMRFGTLDLVRGEWRVYEQPLGSGAHSGKMAVSAVNIEENSDKLPVNYVLPPGISRALDPTQPQLIENNEQALDIVVTDLASGEAKAVYKNTNQDLRQYKRMQMFAHANALEVDATHLQSNQLALFVRLGNDYKNNYYEYEIPLTLTTPGKYNDNAQDRRQVWPEENMLDIPLTAFTQLKKDRNLARAEGRASYTTAFSAYDEEHPQNKMTIMGNPSLGEVKTIMIGVRNLTGEIKSGEVWVNELRLKEYNNSGGWAAQGNLNMQLSDVGTLNVTGRMHTDGFGGLEQGVAERSQDDYKTYSVTANIELGKFFPEKAKVSAPLYYSITKEETRPKYNPLDTDLELSDALDAAASTHDRDSIESIAVARTTNRNFSLSNARVGIQNKRHPMPYDPANFSFSYSHSHRHSSGETTVYEKEDEWRGALSYNWTPVYKPFEPFKGIKSKSKWYDIMKRFGLNWLPQSVAYNTEITRNYYELQERDMENLSGESLPLTFNEQFLWNREFSLRWDFTKNLHMNFNSGTRAQIEEPYTPVNKDLYPDAYSAWKDSVWTSIKHMGTPLDYQQNFSLSYQVPLNLLPIFDWVNADASYTSTYKWVRGTELEDGTNLGNTISSDRNLNLNASFNMEKLYNHIPFLKKANDRFNKTKRYDREAEKKKRQDAKARNQAAAGNGQAANNKTTAANAREQKTLPKNKRAFEKEIKLMPDTTITVNHGKNSKRLIVSAKTKEGKIINLKYKKLDNNKIKILNKVDSATTLKLTVTAREPLEDKGWYKAAQSAARVLMMLRNVSFTYRNLYSMSLPGFMPTIGSMFGQRGGDVLSPGLDFAFGTIDDSYINKAYSSNWLLVHDDIATPATTNATSDLQLRATLEPVKNLKIDLNASRTETKARSIQYMYEGAPTTQTGTFTMTTWSLRSAFESIGSANDGYHSASFERFCKAVGGDYSSQSLIPAFIETYTNMSGGHGAFPKLTSLLPNWSIRYSGLSNLPWFRDHFKSVNLSHSYKSIYAVGAYTSSAMPYDNWQHVSSLWSRVNIPTVSINESFAPFLGVDVTFFNNMTCKLEYRSTRTLSLSMTSIQINESRSNDWVVGMGYKINDVKLFGWNAPKNKNKSKSARNKNQGANAQNATSGSQKRNNNGFNNDLNLRLDISLRSQAAVTRDIASMTSVASSGNAAFKLSFSADYTMSRLLTMSFYFDRQKNTPLLSSSSYPTTTQDFGLSLKFSLTR